MRQKIIQAIIKTIKEIGYRRGDPISEATQLEEIVMDSLDVVEFIAVLSNRYKLQIEPNQMNNISTVGDIADYVLANRGKTRKKHPFRLF